jgi:gliding motility-associated-like protein
MWGIKLSNFILITIALVMGLTVINAQRCEGSLGQNLFTRGDFGSGTDVNVQTDPQIAPGYRYNRIGPPPDGEYTITKNMGLWSGLYGTWLPLTDNSTDPNGYMMVVNASFEPGLFYEEIVDNLCDNTNFEFSADIINIVRAPVTDHIFPNVDFLINDIVVFSTGAIRQTERWNTYSFNYATKPGETSLKLSLRNNAPGGGGNDLALDNISFRACGPLGTILSQVGDTLCLEEMPVRITALQNGVEASPNNRYQWQRSEDGRTWTDIPVSDNIHYSINEAVPGTFWLRFVTAGSPANFSNPPCRFFSEPSRYFIPPSTFEVFDTICGGNALMLGDEIADKPGLYVLNLISQYGCDSIVRIYLDTARRQTLNTELVLTDPSCFELSDGMIEAINTVGGYPPYSITANGIKYPTQSATLLAADAYDIKVEDRFECFYETRVALNEPPEFTVTIDAQTDLILGDLLDVSLTTNNPIAAIDWATPLDEYDNQSSFSLLPTNNLSIAVKVTDENGCVADDQINISLKTDVAIYVPNAFSPNNDRINDSYFISTYGRSLSHLSEFVIYDRWGGQLFDASTTGIEKWDGTYEGKPLEEGTYAYRLTAVLINGDEIKQEGSIILFR